jgi:dipeptidyl aminopeptidase/acylaminoacyl peptidase
MKIARYGTWKSPLTAARVTAGSLRFDHLVVDGDDLYWVEGRASEGGRNIVVRRTSDDKILDLTPAGFNVRTRVHEYGGAAYTIHDGTIYFSNFDDQRLYRQLPDAPPEALTAQGYFFADCRIDVTHGRLLCVREDHTTSDLEPANTIVAVSIAAVGGSPGDVLVSGADFYSDPVVNRDGSRLAWLQWNHANMPWDGTELWVADVQRDGSLGARCKVAGGVDESIFQPAWSSDGRLYFVSDRSDWWNLYRTGASGATGVPGGRDFSPAANDIEALHPMNAEFGKPQWKFSQVTYAFINANQLALTYTQHGRWRLAVLDLEPRRFQPIDISLQPTEGICAVGRDILFIGGSATEPLAIVRIDARTNVAESIRSSATGSPDISWVSAAEAVTFESNAQPVHAFYYAPKNPDFAAPPEERPPLIVVSHGGPTGATSDVLDEEVQFWTSRGFAVLDVNYSGSTGYGRAYRDRLKGQWGVLDVADCVNGATHLVAADRADPRRLIIRGGSAGGYTTLAALTFHDVFKAGASYYGISDIDVLAQDTHKFESRYLDSLVGPYPAAREVYRQRSPIHFTDRLSAALILFQGLEDKVVPPNQAEMMADAARKKGLPVAYIAFEGEQHGFRRAENIVRSLEAELYFYGAVFRFEPADPIEPVSIDNLS